VPYGVLAGEQDPGNERIYNCTGWWRSPSLEDAPSKQAIIALCAYAAIFALLEETKPGAGGEIQLTDGIKALLKEEKVYGYTFEGNASMQATSSACCRQQSSLRSTGRS